MRTTVWIFGVVELRRETKTGKIIKVKVKVKVKLKVKKRKK